MTDTSEVTELRLTNLEKGFEKLDKIIDGNGKMGLKTKVNLMFYGHIPLSMLIGALIKDYVAKIIG